MGRRIGYFILIVFLTGCARGWQGPIADKPISSTTPGGDTQIQTLWDTIIGHGVPATPLREAFNYFDANRGIILNRGYMTIVDFSQPSWNQRLYLINLDSGDVDKLLVAHGEGTDPNDTGYAQFFSNEIDSHKTSLGFYLAGESYDGDDGLSMRLEGLQSSNSNAMKRVVVVHGASYVDPSLGKIGRSWGCPAVEFRWINTVVSRLQGDSLFYAYTRGL